MKTDNENKLTESWIYKRIVKIIRERNYRKIYYETHAINSTNMNHSTFQKHYKLELEGTISSKFSYDYLVSQSTKGTHNG